MNRSLIALPAVLLLALGAARAQEEAKTTTAAPKATLRLKHVEGTTSHFVVSSTMKVAISVAGQDMGQDMDTQMFMEQKVLGVKDGVATVTQRIYRIKIKADSMMAQVDYDSDDENSDAGMMENATEMLDQTFELKIDASGKVLDVKAPEGFDPSSMRGVGSDGDMKSFFDRNNVVLPEGPIAVGEPWESESENNMGQMGKMKVKSTNKLVKIEGGKATIEQVMKLDTSGMQMPAEMQMTPGDASGTTVIDLEKGVVVESATAMKMTMSGEQQGMEMNMEMTMGSSMKQTAAPAPKAKKEEAKTEAKEAAPTPAPVKKDGK